MTRNKSLAFNVGYFLGAVVVTLSIPFIGWYRFMRWLFNEEGSQ